MSNVKFHFEDMDGNVISEHDFLELQRGKTSNTFQFLAVNDGPAIPMVTVFVTTATEPELSLDGESWSGEVNFPLAINASQLIQCRVVLDTDALFGSDTAVIDAYANMNYTNEDF